MTTHRVRIGMVAGVLAGAMVLGSAAVAAPAGAATAGAATSGVGVTSSANPSVAGQKVVLRATVSIPGVVATAVTGTATFTDGGAVLGSAPVTSARASLSTNTLAVGTHDIVVSFTSASGGPATTSATLVQTVTTAHTTVALTTSRPSAAYGAAGTITAAVKPVAPGAGVPTGTVDFSVDGSWFWTSTVDATGKAKLALADLYPSLFPGDHVITATYAGDGTYDPSSSTPITQTIVGLATTPTSTLSLNANGLPVFSPRSFTMSSVSPIGCNVNLVNTTPTAQALVYGTPGAWKRLPFGTIPAGGSTSVGVGIGGYTGYFATMANTSSYVALRCV